MAGDEDDDDDDYDYNNNEEEEDDPSILAKKLNFWGDEDGKRKGG